MPAEYMVLFGTPLKGVRRVSSDHGVVGVVEYWDRIEGRALKLRKHTPT
jgi:hypothetical protein